MTGHESSPKKVKVLVVAKGIESSRKSKADIVRRIEAICAAFDVTIVTTCSEECRLLFRNARVIGVPRVGLPKGSAVFMLCCWFLLPFLRSDVVYLSEVYNASAIVTLCKRRVLCYGNTHPMQHILSVNKGRKFTSGTLSGMYRLILRCGLKKCDLVLAISPQLHSTFLDFGLHECRVRTIEPGVPVREFRPPETHNPGRSGPFIAVYHGTVSLERGLGVMIDGARLLSRRRRDFMIRVVGCDASQLVSLRHTLACNEVSDLFELQATVPYSDIPEILWTAHCGISLLEPNVYFSASPPLKVLEYLAAGLPVIANDLPTHHSYLRHQVDSLIIDYDAVSFSNALERLIVDEPMRKDMSLSAIRKSVDYSDSESISRLIGCIYSLLRGNSCVQEVLDNR